ncbi:MAG: molybdenum cofactor guanylyltransferase [Parvibaculaceae bacterium]|nr:molybdenum cofactor guanylyltransferase [Parvibaculaceae bacterium]
MKVDGVVVAGGGASRMGGLEKPLVHLRGQPLVDHVVAIARPQVASLALNAKPEAASLYRDTSARDLPVLVETFGGEAGPLGGVLAGLEWAAANGASWLATFPADTPFLPHDLVARLLAAAAAEMPAVAVTGDRVQALCALWPVSARTRLAEGVAAGRYRSLWWTLEEFGASHCPFDDEAAFFNVNTKEDLASAGRMLAAP